MTQANRAWLKLGFCTIIAGIVGAIFGEITVMTMILGFCLYHTMDDLTRD